MSLSYPRYSGSQPLFSLAYMTVALTRSRICVAQTTRAAWARERLIVGRRIEISNAMMPITTSNSTRVKPRGSPAVLAGRRATRRSDAIGDIKASGYGVGGVDELEQPAVLWI